MRGKKREKEEERKREKERRSSARCAWSKHRVSLEIVPVVTSIANVAHQLAHPLHSSLPPPSYNPSTRVDFHCAAHYTAIFPSLRSHNGPHPRPDSIQTAILPHQAHPHERRRPHKTLVSVHGLCLRHQRDCVKLALERRVV